MPADRFVAYRYRNIYESSFVELGFHGPCSLGSLMINFNFWHLRNFPNFPDSFSFVASPKHSDIGFGHGSVLNFLS